MARKDVAHFNKIRSMDVLEALKNDGNALFQQQRFDEAVRVYTSVLDQLRGAGTTDDASTRLETAVRLNRAWAWIQIHDSGEGSDSTLIAAEKDCSAVIEKDPSCVKAFYRRALARDRRGHWKLAREDAAAMTRLEPANPFAGPLLERLRQLDQGGEDEELASKLQQCKIHSGGRTNSSSDTSATVLAGEAEDAWSALQADEVDLQKVYQRPSMPRRNGQKKKQKDKNASANGAPTKGEISHKTDDLWETLRREEITTVAKAFPRSRKGGSVV